MSRRCHTKLQMLTMCLLLSFTVVAFADIYKYVDDSGAVSMTNKLESVPKKHRASMTVTKDDAPQSQKMLPEVQKRNSDPLPQTLSADQPATQDTVAAHPDNTNRYMRSGLLFCGIIAAYFLIGRLAGALGFPRIGSALFLLLVLVGGVYLYGVYAAELRTVFGSLRKDALNIRKNVETREQKTDQLLKQIPEKE